MNKQFLLDQLAFLDQRNLGVELYLVIKDQEGYKLRFADLEQELTSSLVSQFATKIKETFSREGNYSVLDIDRIDDDRANVFYFFREDSIPQNLDMITEVRNNQDISTFSFEEDNIEDLTGFLIKIGNDQNEIILYKKNYPVSLLKRGTVLRIIPCDHRFQKFNENVVDINEKFDFLYVGSNLVIVNLQVLERFFHYNDVIEGRALRNLTLIDEKGWIEDIEVLGELIRSNKGMAKKLMRISSESPVLQNQLMR